MAWLSSIIKAILEWLTAEVKKDTKASDSDEIPKDIKDKWRKRIEESSKKNVKYFKFSHPSNPSKWPAEIQEAKESGYVENEEGKWVKYE